MGSIEADASKSQSIASCRWRYFHPGALVSCYAGVTARYGRLTRYFSRFISETASICISSGPIIVLFMVKVFSSTFSVIRR